LRVAAAFVCRFPPADAAAALCGDVGVLHAAARTALVAAAGLAVDRRPRAPFGFLLADAALLVAFLDVLGLALLLVGVSRFVSTRHDPLLMPDSLQA
jgi:hypothetical protein